MYATFFYLSILEGKLFHFIGFQFIEMTHTKIQTEESYMNHKILCSRQDWEASFLSPLLRLEICTRAMLPALEWESRTLTSPAVWSLARSDLFTFVYERNSWVWQNCDACTQSGCGWPKFHRKMLLFKGFRVLFNAKLLGLRIVLC